MSAYSLIRPLLFRLDPETAHDLTLKSLRIANQQGLTQALVPSAERKPVELLGLRFPNPVGLAAGLDKNGEYIDALAALGFGFIEVGTVTPRPQPGNPKPRMFRIPEARAIINRMGFNNRGVDYLIEGLKQSKYRGILGINIGKNFDTPIERASEDYLICLRKVYPYASYVTINVSSPNTKNLRDLQHPESMGTLLGLLKKEQGELGERYGKRVPLVVKIAPDLEADDLQSLAEIFLEYGIDAVIATNTTISREKVRGLPHGDETGGLSGGPLFDASTRVVQDLARLFGSRIPIIAAGGILSAEDARKKKRAGASLIQLYSGLVYRGPELIRETVRAFGDTTEPVGSG